MIRIFPCTAALALGLAAPAVLADVTPEEVWQSWQDKSMALGQDVTFDRATRTGDTLSVTGLVLTHTDQSGSSFLADFGTLAFKDNGDGTVAVTPSETYPIRVAFPEDSDGPTALRLTVSQPGMLITASGTVANISYALTGPTFGVRLDEVTGPDGQPVEAKADLMLTELAARYVIGIEGDATVLDSSFSAKDLVFSLSGEPPDGDGSIAVALTQADLSGTTKGRLLPPEVMADMAKALNEGFNMETTLSLGAMALTIDAKDADGPVKLATSFAGGQFDLDLDRERLSYGSGVTGGSLTVAGPEIPFPEVAIGFAESAVSFLMPLSKSETPQDFGFVTKLVGLTMSDDIWGLIDPSATLSREPASLILDIAGTGFWKQDIMDPAFQAEGAEPDGELTSLDLSEIVVRALGAEMGATGGLTFDNSDLVTFDGVPAPTGSITVTIKGANALIDNLITMGLLPQDQAIGARMMLALFARPGPAPDELTSQVEFKDGGVFANGQRLQ